MRRKQMPLVLILSAWALPTTATAGTAAFDEGMAPIVGEYEAIHEALAGDKTEGVARAAKKIARLATTLKPGSVTGEHAAHYKPLPMKIKAAAKKLAKAAGIAKQREAFKELSRPLAMWAAMSKPAGINVLFCSMAKGSWLQRAKLVANPYYGAKMLRCGEVVSGPHKGHAGGHMKGGHGHRR